MAQAFNWEDHPIEDKNKFNWEDHPVEQQAKNPSIMDEIKEGALNTIAPAMGVAGGFIGAPILPPAGSVGGAALGYAGGKQIERGIRHMIGDDSDLAKTREALYINQPTRDLAHGAEQEMIGQSIGSVGQGPNVLGGIKKIGDRAAIQSISPTIRQGAKMIQGTGENPLQKVNDLSNFARDQGIMQPMSNAEKMLIATRGKLKDIGSQIGEIRDKNESAVQDYITRNSDSPDVQDYQKNVFNPQSVKDNIISQIDKDYQYNPRKSEAIKNNVLAELDPMIQQMQSAQKPDQSIPIKGLTNLKAEWQDNVKNWQQAKVGDLPEKQQAYAYLQKAADNAISNEIALGDKIYQGQDLSIHNKLKKDYGFAKTLEPLLEKKTYQEFAKPAPGLNLNPMDLFGIGNIGNNPAVKTTLATVLPNIANVGSNVGQVLNTLSRPAANIMQNGKSSQRSPQSIGSPQPEQMIEGFPQSQTMSVAQMAQKNMQNPMVTEQMVRSTLDKDESLSNIQKAKRLQLLNKHGLIYMGQ